MRLKTFLASYALFIGMLFTIVVLLSAHMTTSQLQMHKNRSIREYETITLSLARDLAVVESSHHPFGEITLEESRQTVVNGYLRFYRTHEIHLDFSYQMSQIPTTIEFTAHENGESWIQIRGSLPEPFENYRLSAAFDISESMEEIHNIQRQLILFSSAFSVLTAIGLYFILIRIFKPLEAVARSSQKLAAGNYDERITLKGESELVSMADDFNQMAAQIQRQIRQLKQEAVQKQEFVDHFAHEIRTPLTSIYGYAELINKTALDEEEQIEFTGYIMDEANHMKKIANSLLELATLRDFEPQIERISLEDLFVELRQTLQPILEAQHIQLEVQVKGAWIPGQYDLIKSLLLNLCFNAIKACTPGEGMIVLMGDDETLMVSDNGCGIPAQSIPQLTEPFFRVDKARSRESGGTGIGLAIVSRIVEVHGASLTIESQVKEGTIVTVSFGGENHENF